MTFVGKVLVILNLIFSVATSALIVMVFSARTNWKNEYDKVKNLLLVVEAARNQEKTQAINDLKGKEELTASLSREREQLKSLIASKDAAIKEAQDKFQSLENMNNKETNNQEKLVKQVASLKEEREKLVQDLTQREALITQKTNEANEFQKKMVQNDILFKASQNRLEELLKNYEDLGRKYSDLQRQTGLTSSGGSTGSDSILNVAPPPAPKDVRGQIVATRDKLAEISIGADQGLKVGNILDVYRINPNKPADSVYLGTLKLDRVIDKRAVGTFTSKSREKTLQVGDEVAASVGGR